ncbi:MAG: hypothetical protein ABWK53_02345 [Anaerolineales bacterium]
MGALSFRRLQNFWRGKGRLALFSAALALRAPARRGARPVIFFHASTRLDELSLNAAFSLLAAWAVRLSGTPVVHFVCRAGMSRCVLGADPDRPDSPPPCRLCVRQSAFQAVGAPTRFFDYQPDSDLAARLESLSVDELAEVTHAGLPLGALVLPSVRWRLRRHHLPDDEPTRFLFRQFLLSAWNVARRFERLLDETNPQAVVVFNGQFFPEATAAFLARRRGVRTVTHEVGLRPLSAYFTLGEATAYPIAIPASFDLNEAQNARLDAYLEERFQGRFTMAGIQFWPEMRGLDAAFLQKAAAFRQIVPVFTNVIFDTSQPHSNVLFPDMFAWLDLTLEVIRAHPETLFVIRAHPDETRPGKSSRESVADWVAARQATALPNLVFIPSDQYLSSYELIQRSKFVMIYNSTIGLEASILGAAVLCAGRARFTQYPTVFFPADVEEYRRTLEAFLRAEHLTPPAEHRRHARRFLYYQLFRTSLPCDDFLTPSGQRGYVHLKADALARLSLAHPTLQTMVDGILHDGDFLLKESL